jgi:UDP-glucose 4-epimerase
MVRETTLPVAAVLGSNGFIGTHLVSALLRRGYFVVAFDRTPSASAPHTQPDRYREITGDFFNEGTLDEVLTGCDLCFHLVSTTVPADSNRDPHFDAQSNICGSLQLLNAAVRHKIKKVIFTSSGGTVYGTPVRIPITETHPTEPMCSYGITKLTIEKYLALYHRLHGLKSCSLRLANPYGPGQRTSAAQGAIAVFIGNVMRNKPVHIWGDGSVVRDFIYVADMVEGMVMAAEAGLDCDVFNIGSGKGVSLNEIIAAISKAVHREVDVIYEPSRLFDVPANILDIRKAQGVLNWFPRTTLEEGLSLTWKSLTKGGYPELTDKI